MRLQRSCEFGYGKVYHVTSGVTSWRVGPEWSGAVSFLWGGVVRFGAMLVARQPLRLFRGRGMDGQRDGRDCFD